jgi:hypothetical protein
LVVHREHDAVDHRTAVGRALLDRHVAAGDYGGVDVLHVAGVALLAPLLARVGLADQVRPRRRRAARKAHFAVDIAGVVQVDVVDRDHGVVVDSQLAIIGPRRYGYRS